MQETQCPKCGEWLSVPPEFADRPVKCGSCGRVIQPHERDQPSTPPPPPPSAGPRFPENDPPGSRGPRFPDREFDDAPPRRKGGGLWVWLLLAFVGVGCCGCGGIGLFFLAAANPKWEPYTADNGAFTAEFPGKPVYQTKPFRWKDDTEGTGHEYGALQLINAQGFGVHYADLPKSMLTFRPSDEKLLKVGLEELKRDSTNFTVQNSTETTIGKYKAIDVEGTMTDPQHGLLQVYVRVMIVGDRVFTLVAAGKDKAKLTPAKERFFNSFKPADPKDKGGEPKGK